MLNIQVHVPNLVLAQRVIDKMVIAAQRFVEDETGEAMVGIIDPGLNTGGIPTLYVLDTIAPDETAEREFYSFEQGDDFQGDIFLWLADNWEIQRKKGLLPPNPRWNVALSYIGDWHRQPGFMIAPSGGDLRSAMDQLDDEHRETDFLLVPIVTLGHPSTTGQSVGTTTNYLTAPLDDGTNARIDFWYIKQGVAMFLPIHPVVYPDDQLPALTPYPWHLLHENRAELEIGQLEYDQLFVSDAIQWDVDEVPPVEICFIVARQGASRLLLLVTHHDFPKKAPKAYVAPFQPMSPEDDQYDMFEKLWAKATPVSDPPGWKWSEDQYLIDYVHAIEDALGIERPEIPTADDLKVDIRKDGVGGGANEPETTVDSTKNSPPEADEAGDGEESA
ncbi:MAG TPA: hypothetical protein VHL11_19280 [Phototrophicaceae bacterium]|jgi:hypothetical protein|nr:hypothetical protein [Phototrophicaceae bacterium]